MAVHLGNESAARRQQRLEPDLERNADREADVAAAEHAEPRTKTPSSSPSALSQLLPPSPRDPNAQRARWGRDPEADSRRLPRRNADDPVATRPATPATPATPAAPAVPRRTTGERPAGYVGERAVDAAWLQQRESALKALRADYEAARAKAQAGSGGAGWVEAADSGNAAESNGAPPAGTLQFSEEAFAAHCRAQQSAQPGAALKALAACYGADAATLFAKQPTLWTLATQDHALNAGPPPPGRAMGDARTLGTLDLYLADPQIAALVSTYGGTAAAPHGGVAYEQVRLYGAERFAQLSRLGNAMAAVRNQYSTALAQAEQRGSGVGWSEHTQTVTEVGDNENAYRTTTQQVTTRTFDPDAFTAWYIKQDGQANKAFASFYGRSHTTYSEGHNNVGGESGESRNLTRVATLTFDNQGWTLSGIGNAMSNNALVAINVNDPPRLNNNAAVGFDLDAGWVTAPGNIHKGRDWFETVVQVVIVAGVSWVSMGTLGPQAAGAMGFAVGSTGAAVVGAAVGGAAASVASGAMNGNLTWKSVLQGALAGGLSAGLMSSLGSSALVTSTGPAGQIALRTTVQGGIQALLGGKFKDGAIAGFASGLADLAKANMESGIEAAVKSGQMTAGEAIAARTSARVIGSALRALGNPNDPQYGFASAFINELMPKQATTPAAAGDYRNGADIASDNTRPAIGAGPNAQQGDAVNAPRGNATPPGPSAGPPDDPQGPQDPNVQRIVINGRVWPKDEFGNQLEVDAQGRGVLHLAGGGLLAIGLVSEALPGLGIGVAGSARTIAGSLLARLTGPIALPLMLSGDTPRVTLQISDRIRFERFEDQAYGRLFERDPTTGQWELTRDNVREYERPGGGFEILSEEERARQGAPITTPARPPGNTSPPPLPVQGNDRDAGTPGYVAPPPAGPPLEGSPIEPIRPEDLIMEQRNSEILGDDLRAKGINPPDMRPDGSSDYEAHHIVPSRAGDARMDDIRAKLSDWDIDLNSAANGLWLPGPDAPADAPEAYHRTLNNKDYNNAVISELRNATTREEAIETLARIGEKLKEGNFPGVRPKPGKGG